MASSALDMALRGPLTDEEFAPSPTVATAVSKPKATAPSTDGGISGALAKAQSEGRELYERAASTFDELSSQRTDLMSSMRPPDLTDLESLIKAKPTPKKTDPIEAFGSAASLAAIFGSLLTRTPLTSALNNASAVMEAYKANDAAKAQQEFDLWKANIDNAETLFKFQQDAYDNAFKKLDTNSKAAADEMRILTSAFDDTVLKPLIEQGRWQNARDLMAQRVKLNEQIRDAKPTLLDWNARYQGFLEDAAEKNLETGTPEWLMLYNEWMTKPRTGGGEMTEGQDYSNMLKAFEKKYPLNFYNERPKGAPTLEDFAKTEWPGLKKAVAAGSGDGAAIVESTAKKPAARALPPQLQSATYPEGTTFEAEGWRWEKRGGKAVAVAPLAR